MSNTADGRGGGPEYRRGGRKMRKKKTPPSPPLRQGGEGKRGGGKGKRAAGSETYLSVLWGKGKKREAIEEKRREGRKRRFPFLFIQA